MTEEKFAELTLKIWRAHQRVEQLLEQYKPTRTVASWGQALVFETEKEIRAYTGARRELELAVLDLRLPEEEPATMLDKKCIRELLAA